MKKLIQNIVPITVILFISNLGHILYANSVKSYRQDRHTVMTTVSTVDSSGNTIYTQKPTTKVTTRNYIGDFIKTGNYTWEVPTDDGHIFIDTRNKIKTHYYYVRDYLGSTRAVVDTAGMLLQTMNYYPSGVPFSRMEQEPVTDRLHTGKPFLDMNGLGYYDNNARFLDILTGGFISRDALSSTYPHLSHYAHCANNPLIYIDPTGMFVIADATSQQNIINTLSPEEANFISFNEQGMIDIDLLNKSASMSENFTALKALANSEINYMFRSQISDSSGKEFYDKSETLNYRGITEMPGATKNPSPDENVHIIVGSILSEKQQVLTTAHEAYGHAYFYELTRDVLKSSHTFIQKTKVEWDYEFNVPSYTSIKIPTNIKLEKQIKLVVQQALRNYESR